MPSVISLRVGQKGRVIGLKPASPSDLKKFIAFGLTQGTMVEVIQESPVYVLQIDFTQLAIDKQTAAGIIVELK